MDTATKWTGHRKAQRDRSGDKEECCMQTKGCRVGKHGGHLADPPQSLISCYTGWVIEEEEVVNMRMIIYLGMIIKKRSHEF